MFDYALGIFLSRPITNHNPFYLYLLTSARYRHPPTLLLDFRF